MWNPFSTPPKPNSHHRSPSSSYMSKSDASNTASGADHDLSGTPLDPPPQAHTTGSARVDLAGCGSWVETPSPSLDSDGSNTLNLETETSISISQASSRWTAALRVRSTLTGDRREKCRSGEARRRIDDWFQGEFGSINLGIVTSPTKEKMNALEGVLPFLGRTAKPAQGKPSSPVISKPLLTSPLSFLSSRLLTPKRLSPAIGPSDELMDLDIKKALIPASSSGPQSPETFKHILQKAEELLDRLQTALKERSKSLREAISEKEAQAEELKGSETRVQHLKAQLDKVVSKQEEQDLAVINLVNDLAREKELRREDHNARKRTPLPFKISRPNVISNKPQDVHGGSRRESEVSVVSDSGFESNDEHTGNACYLQTQRAVSSEMPFGSQSFTNRQEADEDLKSMLEGRTTLPAQIATKDLSQTLSTANYDIDGSQKCSHSPVLATTIGKSSPLECTCHGVHNTEACNIVSVLKEENQGLKDKVEELEETLRACLSLVGG